MRVSEDLKSLKVRVSKLVELYEQSPQLRQGSQQHRGSRFPGRRLYNMTAEIIMFSLFLMTPHTLLNFSRRAPMYVRHAEEEVMIYSLYQELHRRRFVNFRAAKRNLETAE